VNGAGEWLHGNAADYEAGEFCTYKEDWSQSETVFMKVLPEHTPWVLNGHSWGLPHEALAEVFKVDAQLEGGGFELTRESPKVLHDGDEISDFLFFSGLGVWTRNHSSWVSFERSYSEDFRYVNPQFSAEVLAEWDSGATSLKDFEKFLLPPETNQPRASDWFLFSHEDEI
jgi:hypothetical protein